MKILICSFYPAWDHVYSAEEMKGKLEEAEELVVSLRGAIAELDTGQDLRDLTKLVSKKMEMQMLSENPLFFSIVSLRYQNSIWEVFGVY